MMITKKVLRFGIVPILLLMVAGCGRRDLEPLSGTVVHINEPLKCGSIIFVTTSTTGGKNQKATAPPTIAGIKDGQFSVPKKYGLKQGTYRVTIRGFEGTPRGSMPLGLDIFQPYETDFEYTGQETVEFKVPTRKRKLPKADASGFDPISPQVGAPAQ